MRAAIIILIGLVMMLVLAAVFTIVDRAFSRRGWMKRPGTFLYYLMFCFVIVIGNILVFTIPSLSRFRYILPAACVFIFLVGMSWLRRAP